MCRVLKQHDVHIAPSTFYVALTRQPSARCLRDRKVTAEISRVFHDRQIGRGLFGVRKVWDRLKQETAAGDLAGIGSVGKGQVERLMRPTGLHGARRGRQFKTTNPNTISTPATGARNLPSPDLRRSC